MTFCFIKGLRMTDMMLSGMLNFFAREQPLIKQGAFTQVSYQVPVTGQVTVQQPYEFQYNGFPVSYTLAVQSPSTPVIVRTPFFVAQNPVQQNQHTTR